MKKILIFIPKFLNYDMQIRKELSKFGYSSDIIYENIDVCSTLFKIVCTFCPNIKNELATKIYERQTNRLENNYEYILIIRGSMITCKYLKKLKKQFKKAKFIMYQWDSLQFNKNALNISNLFDDLFTFDMIDADKYGWNYRPLFYDESKVHKETKKDLDICYICSIHSQRMEIFKQIKESCQKKKFSLWNYLFTQKRSYILHKYIVNDKLFRKFVNEVHTVPLSPEDTNNIYERSKVIIDYTYPGQNGLTMRTIESIGHSCKLITNNKNIIKCDFYNPQNILVYEGCNVKLLEEFVNSPFEPIDSKIFDKYSLKSWIEDIFAFEGNYVN